LGNPNPAIAVLRLDVLFPYTGSSGDDSAVLIQDQDRRGDKLSCGPSIAGFGRDEGPLCLKILRLMRLPRYPDYPSKS